MKKISFLNVALGSGTTNSQWDNQPAAVTVLYGDIDAATFQIDLTYMSHVRLQCTLNSGTPVSGAQVALQYYDVGSASWLFVDGSDGPHANLNPIQTDTTFVPIASGAKGLVTCRVIGRDGDGVADFSLSVNVIFANYAGSGTNRLYSWIDLHRGNHSSYYTFTNQPAAVTEIAYVNTEQGRFVVDLTEFDDYQFNFNINSAGAAGSKILLQYSTNLVTPSWSDLASITIDSTGNIATGWQALPGGAKTVVLLRQVGKDGDGAADPVIGSAGIQFRSDTFDDDAETTALWTDARCASGLTGAPYAPPTGDGLQLHPYNLVYDPNTDITITTAAAGYSETDLRDKRLSRKLRSTTTTLVVNLDCYGVDPGLPHADHIIVMAHNLIATDTIQVESHNGGASIFDQTYTVTANPDKKSTLWTGESLDDSAYPLLFFPFGEDALDGAVQLRITITTQAPNTYVECKIWIGWSLEFDRNYFYGWAHQLAGLPTAATNKVRDVLQLTFGAATDADWRIAQFINRELGTSVPFCISLEPNSDTAATTKDGIRQHRLTFYGRLASRRKENFIDFNDFVMNFMAEK